MHRRLQAGKQKRAGEGFYLGVPHNRSAESQSLFRDLGVQLGILFTNAKPLGFTKSAVVIGLKHFCKRYRGISSITDRKITLIPALSTGGWTLQPNLLFKQRVLHTACIPST